MAVLRMKTIFCLLVLSQNILALQFTPNSPCASVCLDDVNADPSDPGSAYTLSSDIVCSNADLDYSATGQKFETCTNCLRNSTFSDSGENDQSWFIYNLRFALDSCLFQFPNSSASDARSTPCTTSSSCGPLTASLENGYLIPTNESTYSYCSANNNAILGSSLDTCVSCLQDVTDQSYLSNFLVALQAGCVQQPPAGVNIGIRGDIFSVNAINITYPGDNPYADQPQKKGLSQAAIIGIVIGSVALALLLVAFGYVCYRRRNQRRLQQLSSPLDSRFGSKSISSPQSGSYGNPYANSSAPVSQRVDKSASFSIQELKALGLEMPNVSRLEPTPEATKEQEWQDAHAHLEATQSQLPSYTIIPTHQAYIPNPLPNSPATSNTSGTYHASANTSSRTSPRTSPRNIPPPIRVSPSRVSSTDEGPLSVTPPSVSSSSSQQTHFGPGSNAQGLPRNSTTSPRISINTKVQPTTGMSRVSSPQDGRLPYAQPRNAPTPPQNYSAQFQPQQSSQIGPSTLHSQNSTRSASRGAARESSTERTTTGGWRLGPGRASSKDRSDPPVRISGPMIRHGGRFDYENAEQDIHERDESSKNPDETPSSAESAEQWPGTY